jgi:hypothetical protein
LAVRCSARAETWKRDAKIPPVDRNEPVRGD